MPLPRISRDQQELIYTHWRRKVPVEQIASLVGVSWRTVYRYVAKVKDMPRPVDAVYDSRYLSRDERYEIARMLDDDLTLREIGRRLGRPPSTISREIRRNSDPRTGYYLPEKADTLAWKRQRRPKESKLGANPRLRARVQQMLDDDWSPEQISGRLPLEFPDDGSMRVSHESIYLSLFVYPRGELTRELKAHLRTGRTGRSPRGSKRVDNRIPGLVSIHERPEEVEGRLVPGHHEGDLIKGSTASNSAVGTIVERHCGYLTLLHLPDGYGAEQVAEAVVAQMSPLPAWFTQTLTWDRGSEMTQHARISAKTPLKVYFADPYSPHQRGTNENTNGLLRQYLPKSTDLSVHTREDLQAIADKLNNRPRKRLGFRTPNEVYATLLRDNLTHGVATTP